MSVHHHKLPIVTDGLIFQVDAANGLGGNVTDTKNLVDPLEVGTFENFLSVVDDAFDFDGVDDYIDMSSSITLLQSYSTGTIDAWVKIGSLVDGERIIGIGGDALNKEVFSLEVRNISGNYNFSVTSTPLTDIVYSTTNLVTDLWYNIVLTSDDTVWKMYLNGQPETVSVLLGGNSGEWFNEPIPTNPVLAIGAVKNNGAVGSFWYGKIQSLKVYSNELTQAEITQNYEATKHNFE